MRRCNFILAVVLAAAMVRGWAFAEPVGRAGRANQNVENDLFDPGKFFGQLFGEIDPKVEDELSQIEISVNEENRLGDDMRKAYFQYLREQRIRITSKGREVRYLQGLVDLLRPFMTNADRYPSIHVYLARSSRTNARSFPGGHLLFFRGILDFAESEAALVAVIGHELSHLDHRHQLFHLKRIRLAQQTFSGNQKPDSVARFFAKGNLLMRAFAQPFRPQDELVADRDGATWCYQAGYDPREFARLFDNLEQRDGQPPVRLPAFFRSHPYHRDRGKAIDRAYAELRMAQPNADLYVGRENLRRRVTRAHRKFAE